MFKRNNDRTPKQKAERAQLNIIVRLAGCGFLIYYAVQLLKTPKEEIPNTTVAIIIAVVFFGLAAFVIALTVIDGVRGLQTGRYKTTTYEDEEMIEYLEKQQAEEAISDSEDTQAEPAADEDRDEDEAAKTNDSAASDREEETK